jgi:hypothetical protein
MIKTGDFVVYTPNEQVGRVKRVTADGFHAFVVFHCNKEWHDYKDYTAARCEIRQLAKLVEWNIEVISAKIIKPE